MPKGGVRRDSSKAVFAEGGHTFFVILTFQKGTEPKLEVLGGKGLDARVKVARQTVNFDGENVVFGRSVAPRQANRRRGSAARRASGRLPSRRVACIESGP